jgi:hypothetical protein
LCMNRNIDVVLARNDNVRFSLIISLPIYPSSFHGSVQVQRLPAASRTTNYEM